jgi:uncharacterized metal-binding protein
MSEKVKVVPCSGIGKVFGLVARETALKVVGELCPDDTETVCLAYLVTGDDAAKEKIAGSDCITVDGCAKMCAAKNVKIAGGSVRKEFKAVDAFKEHHGAQAGTATELTGEGWQITGEIAEKVAAAVKNLRGETN